MTAVGAGATAPEIGAALLRAAEGTPLVLPEIEVLLSSRGDQLEQLLGAASLLRDKGLDAAGRRGVLTYSRKAFIPLTTLCRDKCHYCAFVDTPAQLRRKQQPTFMSEQQVLAVARQAAALGCKEALLTLGDRPETRWPQARAWLDAHGHASTLDYVGRVARLITAETGMLAHLNPGVMSIQEIEQLRPTAPSMGLMLETTSRRLFEEPGQVHFGSPDKDPAVRLEMIEDAGRARVPFTTGILVGIGETVRDRAEALLALREVNDRFGHLQEVIVQNFRAKTSTAMRDRPDLAVQEYIATVAVARLVLGSTMRIQVPPNLSDPGVLEGLVRAGADDWGGVSPLTADHVNPERPWPSITALASRTANLGFTLRERLTVHPEYVQDADRWIDPALRPAVLALAETGTGLARCSPAGGATSESSRSADPDRRPPAATRRPAGRADQTPSRTHVEALAERAADDPMVLDEDEWAILLTASDHDLEAVVAVADSVRRYTVGEVVGIVVNRNLTSSGFRGSGASAPDEFSLDDVGAIAADAAGLGATEMCVQGLVPQTEDVQAYLDIAQTAKSVAPSLHLHAYRPQDVWNFAERSSLGLERALVALQEAGVDTVPGTGVKVISERVRHLVAPTDLEIDRWREAIRAAHRNGLRSTSVLFYGHVETARERIRHLKDLCSIQADAVAAGAGGGFTEFIPIPLPGPAGGVPLVPGRPGLDEHRAMVSVSRLLLSGTIPNIQIPWTRLGKERAADLLRCGGNDLGGTLLDGRVRPESGVEFGLVMTLEEAARLTAGLFRPLRQRSTDYQTIRMIASSGRTAVVS